MQGKLKLTLALILLGISSSAFAQFTTVTGTVTDPNGLPYALGSIAPTLVLNGGTPMLGATPYIPPNQATGLDSSGHFTMTLADNGVLTPAGSRWNFTVCSFQGTVNPAFGKGSVCFTLSTPLTITGANQDITTQLNAAALALTNTFSGGGGGGGTPGAPFNSLQANNAGSFAGTRAQNGTTIAQYNFSTGQLDIPNLNRTRVVTSSYNWLQSPGGSISPGANTVNLAPCPLGIDTSNYTNGPYPVLVGGTGTPEAAIVTGGTCTSGAVSGTIIFTAQGSHAAGFTVGSASTGIQEAINDGCRGANYSSDTNGGNCDINLMPGGANNPANYTISLATVFLTGRNVNGVHLHGNGALVQCSSVRAACIYNGNFAGNGANNEISGFTMTSAGNLDGVQILDVTAAAGTYTIHTASAHPFSMTGNAGTPDWVTVDLHAGSAANTGGTLRGVFQVTSVPDNTHFTVVNGSTTFANVFAFGTASLEQTLIEDDVDYSNIHDMKLVKLAGGTNPNYFIVVDNDQHASLDNIGDAPAGVQCTANFCGAMVWGRGDSGNSSIVYLKNSELSMQCQGNGFLTTSGNGWVVENTVIQGFSQYGIFAQNGLQSGTIRDVYEESSGGCNNPQAPAAAQHNQVGFFTSAGSSPVRVMGPFPLQGTFPMFVSGGGSGSQINYYVVWHLGGAASTTLPAGIAQPLNGGVTIPVSFPYVALGTFSAASVTFDLLATTGTTYTTITGTQTIAVATGQTCTPTATGWCTFNDTQGARSSYTRPSGANNNLFYWPGQNIVQISGTMILDVAPLGINGYLTARPALFAQECNSTGVTNSNPMQTPAAISCVGSDPSSGPTTGLLFNRVDASGNSFGGLKGYINFLTTGNMLGGPPGTHFITLIDSNANKTGATAGNAPPNDPNDAFIGTDCANGQFCVSIGARDHIAAYIGNVGDGTNFKWLTNSAGTTFQQPVNTNSQINSTLATGTAPFTIASTTPVANLTVSNHPRVQNCGTTSTCSATAISGAQIVFGSAALASGSPSTVTITGISPAFSSNTSYVCTVTNGSTQANPLKVTNVSSSSFTITGPNTVTDQANYVCVGN